MNEVMFSVIVPVYNVAPFLAECLESVLHQTYPNWECICVDDGSTDACAEILDRFAAQDARFVVKHKVNGGVASARNMALELMRGQWFLFLDSDDVLDCFTLAHGRALIEKEPTTDIFAFGYCCFSEASKCCFSSTDVTPSYHVKQTLGAYCHHWGGFTAFAKIFRRSVFCDLREKPYCVGEDLLYLTQCMLRVAQVVQIDSILYGYRQRMRSAVHGGGNSFHVMLDSLNYLTDIALELGVPGRCLSPVTRKWLGNALTERTVWEYWALSDKENRAKIRECWYGALSRLSPYWGVFGLFQKVRMAVLLHCRSSCMEWILGYLPSYLKRRAWRRK